MKKITLLFIVVLFTTISSMAQVAINKDGSTPDASSILDVQATDAGFLPPRMKTTERDAIGNPAEGLVIYNITTGCLEFYKGGIWIQLCGNSGTPENGAEYSIGSGGSCQNTVVAGIYRDGKPMNVDNTVTIDVLVSVTGDASVSTNTVNGYSFSGSKTFNSTGVKHIILNGSGTPLAVQTDSFTATADHGGGTCEFSVTVNPQIPHVLNPTTGEIWMDRNLGASQVATGANDAAAFGDLYQWGRYSEGHEDRSNGNTGTNATTPIPDDGNTWDGLFITESNSPNDWLTPQDNTLWQGLSGTNNPCPGGYRIPTEAEWDAERLSWTSNDPVGAFTSPLKLTLAGHRSGVSGVVDTQAHGYYWSSSVNGIQSYRLYFLSGNAGTDTQNRAHGFSIRCIRE